MNQHAGKNQDIELLRAVAVLAVILHHAHSKLLIWPSNSIDQIFMFFGGGMGVDLFFVISGFVIARSFLLKLQEAQHSSERTALVLAFWVRRIYRIFPLAWSWLLFIMLATLFFNHSGAFGSVEVNWAGTVAAIMQIANFRVQDCMFSYPCGETFVYWSLSLEEQFYIALPLFALLLRRYLVWFLAALLLYKLFTDFLVLSMGLRFEGLVLGVLLAIWSRHPSYKVFEPETLGKSPLLGVVFLALACTLLFSIQSKAGKPVPLLLSFKMAALISGLLVWVASYGRNYLMPWRWCQPLYLWVGSRSFALYLVHVPAFLLTRELWFRATGSQDPEIAMRGSYVALGLSLLIAFSELSYRLIEVPMRNRGIAKSKTILAQPSLAAPAVDTAAES